MTNKGKRIDYSNEGFQRDKVSKVINPKPLAVGREDIDSSNSSNSSRLSENNTFIELGDWGNMTPGRWQNVIYGQSNGFFMQLWKDTLNYIVEGCQKFCGDPADCALIEVGCGTGNVLLGIASKFCFNLGIDINKDFLGYARKVTPRSVERKVVFIRGCVTQLTDLLNSHSELAPSTHPSQRKVVVCVNNTIGIFPEPIKDKAYQQMKEVAGEDGIIVVGFWNGKHFGEALQHFYHLNPTLCGNTFLCWKDLEYGSS